MRPLLLLSNDAKQTEAPLDSNLLSILKADLTLTV